MVVLSLYGTWNLLRNRGMSMERMGFMKKGMRKICAATTMAAMLLSAVPIATPVAHAKPDWANIAGGVLGAIIAGSRNSDKKSGSSGGDGVIGGLSNQKHARKNPNDNEKLFILAITSNDYDTAKALLDTGNVDINGVYKGDYFNWFADNGITPLYWAINTGNRLMMQFLLENGADVTGYYNYKNDHISYLVWAVSKQDLSLIEFLHNWGAPINDKRHMDILNVAVGESWYGNWNVDRVTSIVKYLLDNGAYTECRAYGKKAYSKDTAGTVITPFLLAISYERPSLASLLADYGADINAKDGNGKNALQIAIDTKNLELYKYIQDIMARGQQPSKYSEIQTDAQAKETKNKEILAY